MLGGWVCGHMCSSKGGNTGHAAIETGVACLTCSSCCCCCCCCCLSYCIAIMADTEGSELHTGELQEAIKVEVSV
jgi:hypothetical protein